MRVPEYPKFTQHAELLLRSLPVLVAPRDWHECNALIEKKLQYMFTQGLQEARERLIANPALIHEKDL